MNQIEVKHTLKIATISSSRMLGLFMLFPVFSIYANQYKASPILIGAILGIYGLTQACLQIPFGYLSDKYGRNLLLIIGLVLFLSGSILAALATDAITLLIARALQGSGAIASVLMASIADVVSVDNRLKANTIFGAQIGLSFIIALIIAPFLTHYVGLSGLFWFIALLAIIALVIVITLPPTNRINTNLNLTNFKKILTTKLLRLDLSVYFLHFILSAIFVILPLLLNQHNLALLDNWQFYLPVLIFSFALMMPFIIWAHKANKINKLLLFSVAMLVIIELFLFIGDKNLFTLSLLTMLFFTCFNIIEASLPSMVANNAHPDHKGMAMGVFSSAKFLGIFSGGLAGGLVFASFNLSSIFLLASIASLVWFVALFITRDRR